jgi:hypothetical protein
MSRLRGTCDLQRNCYGMNSTPFLPECPKCGFWPMAASQVDYGFHTRVKFVCSNCTTVSDATIRHASSEYRTENSLVT